MKKIYLLSLMLMGSISLFTSCVNVDYYDLYEDEEEYSSPLKKQGKEVPSDLSAYPRLQEEGEYNGWHECECIACAYSNITGNTDKAQCRAEIIAAWYGIASFHEGYEAYFDAVTTRGQNHPLPGASGVLSEALNWRHITTEQFVDSWLSGYLSGNICVLIKNGHGGTIDHVGVAAVPTSISWSWPFKNRGTIWFYIKDQGGVASRHDFSLVVDKYFNIISAGDAGAEITGFVVP